MTKFHQTRGFSLVELAVVLIIVGILISALFVPLQAQREHAALIQTKLLLADAQKALLGYAQTNGRLPCPATVNSNGTENPLGGGTCVQYSGFLPAVTLSLSPVDSQGFALDAWNNRIRYAVTTLPTSTPFTTASGLNNIGILNLGAGTAASNLRICASATGVTATDCGAVTTNTLSGNAVAIIFSTGATAAQGAGGVDESANLDNDAVFVSHDVSAASSTNGEFDHLLTWISPYVLYGAMIDAGQLH